MSRGKVTKRMKVTIDLEDLKEFVNSLEKHKDEWYGPINYMTGDSIAVFS